MDRDRSRPIRRQGLGRRFTVRNTTLAGLLLVGAVVVQACAATGMGGGMMGGGMMGGQGSARENAPPPSVDAAEIVVVAGDIWFQPNKLRISAGETVNLTLDNQGAAFHDLTIGDLDFVLAANGGEGSSGALTVDVPGTYEFFCSVPGHAQAGMTGTLIVE